MQNLMFLLAPYTAHSRMPPTAHAHSLASSLVGEVLPNGAGRMMTIGQSIAAAKSTRSRTYAFAFALFSGSAATRSRPAPKKIEQREETLILCWARSALTSATS